MESGGASISGPRPYNEDSYLIRELDAYETELGGLRSFIMVSDGMGGHQSGDVASRVAVEAAGSYIDHLVALASQGHVEVDVALALREIVAEANEAVQREASALAAESMGATFVAAFVSRDKVWAGHVGDSRAYILHDGQATQVTQDHSQVGRMIAEGILTEQQAQSHPNRNVIERALGFGNAEAEVNSADLNSGDAVLLCSDGLSTVLAGQDMADVAVASRDAVSAAAALTAEALKAGTDDNATVVIWSDDWKLFRSSAPRTRAGKRAKRGRRGRKRRLGAAQWSWIGLGVVLGIAAVIIFATGGVKTTGGGAVTPVTSVAPTSQGSSGGLVTSNNVVPTPKPEPRPDSTGEWVSAYPDPTEDVVWLRSEPTASPEAEWARLKRNARVEVRPRKSPEGFWIVNRDTLDTRNLVGSVKVGEIPARLFVYPSSLLLEETPKD